LLEINIEAVFYFTKAEWLTNPDSAFLSNDKNIGKSLLLVLTLYSADTNRIT
jgi:hypothetical protein